MTIQELMDACQRSIILKANTNSKDDAKVRLVIPRLPYGRFIRMAGSGTPLGEVLCAHMEEGTGKGTTVALFDAVDVLAFCCALQGLAPAPSEEAQP
jgi:hypothetical protein